MEKLNMQTADVAELNIRRIAELYPGSVTETRTIVDSFVWTAKTVL